MGEGKETVLRMMEDNPRLHLMWEEYELCRSTQWIHFTHKSKDGKTEYPVHALHATHIATWPNEGGVLEQPYMYVKIFRAFLEGEREGTLRKIEKMRKG